MVTARYSIILTLTWINSCHQSLNSMAHTVLEVHTVLYPICWRVKCEYASDSSMPIGMYSFLLWIPLIIMCLTNRPIPFELYIVCQFPLKWQTCTQLGTYILQRNKDK